MRARTRANVVVMNAQYICMYRAPLADFLLLLFLFMFLISIVNDERCKIVSIE